jgi:L-threo-3-deoxy-hexylosonate aldolase
MAGSNLSGRPLRPGVYAAALTFFQPETENLDIPTIRKHAIRLVESGIVGFVVLGSNGEAPHLNREERLTVVCETRAVLDDKGYDSHPIIVGCSDQSVRGTLEIIKDAAAAGGDYALVLPPSYFRSAMSMDTIRFLPQRCC